jgi:hypothetical protein
MAWVGAIASTDLDISMAQIDKNGYLWINIPGKGREGIDFGNYVVGKHGVPHVDLYDGLVKSLGTQRINLFIEGFLDSFM